MQCFGARVNFKLQEFATLMLQFGFVWWAHVVTLIRVLGALINSLCVMDAAFVKVQM